MASHFKIDDFFFCLVWLKFDYAVVIVAVTKSIRSMSIAFFHMLMTIQPFMLTMAKGSLTILMIS